MPRIEVPFVVVKQHITQPTRVVLMSGGQTYFYATFEICDVWEDLADLKAVFRRDNVSKLMSLNERENGLLECQIPWEVMTDKGLVRVGIFAGNRMLTDEAIIRVGEGCICEGSEPTAPTPDWFDKVENDISVLNSKKANKDDVTEYVNEQTAIIKSDVEGLQQQIKEESHFRGYTFTNEEITSSDATPNDFAYSAESGTVWVYDAENGWKDTGTPVPDQLTPPSDATPLVDGEATPGRSEKYARGDHRHPTDTTRASVKDLNDVCKQLGDTANALKNAVSGEHVISLDDVSSIPHKVAVQLSSDTVTDFSTVKLTTCGKNWFNQYAAPTNNISPYYTGVDITNLANTLKGNFYYASIALKEGKTIPETRNCGLVSLNASGSIEAMWFVQNGSITNTEIIFTPWVGRQMAIATNSSDRKYWDAFTDAFEIQVGTKEAYADKPSIEPFIGGTYTPNADGTVNVKSVSPVMNIFCDTEGVAINCDYNRDINKAFAELQNAIISLGGNI